LDLQTEGQSVSGCPFSVQSLFAALRTTFIQMSGTHCRCAPQLLWKFGLGVDRLVLFFYKGTRNGKKSFPANEKTDIDNVAGNGCQGKTRKQEIK